MGAAFGEAAASVEEDDLVGLGDRRQLMGYNDDRRPAAEVLDGTGEDDLVFGVQSCGSFVQEDDAVLTFFFE